ncbi:MAG TPA: DUF4910 domain-containing protein [Bryobacteraceae bacterium]|nr:DUF4910 domain-containing protein [Bryobacteraceae bacterium]
MNSATGIPRASDWLGAEYTASDLTHALWKTGIRQGDTVFVHACFGVLGALAGPDSEVEPSAALLDAITRAVGPTGTILVPTYTFSFCRGEDYDVLNSASVPGPWSLSSEFLETVRMLPGAFRSDDPIHSVAGIGPRAEALLADVASTCFGPGSIFDRLNRSGAKLCVIGAPLEEATFRHHVEEMVGVPFRYKKLFTGYIRRGSAVRKAGWIYFVRIRADNGIPDGSYLERITRSSGECRAASVGAGEVLTVDAGAYYERVATELKRNPWCSAKGPAGNAIELERTRTGAPCSPVTLPPAASMEQIVSALWRLPRDIVSDGFDVALQALADQLPMRIHEFPSGTECWDWIVPEKWTCAEAWLETLDGRKVFSYADHPLHVVSYSLPFAGRVSRDELFRHLHVHPWLPDAIPFNFKYYERDWGLCCTQRQRDALQDEAYRVVIRSDFAYSTLKTGEIVVPGRTDKSIVLCAHLCHPAMVNDDLTGVAVGVEVIRKLLARKAPRYTYRFVIVPETIGSIAWLSRNEELTPEIKGGLFLEMLGRATPHALQLSFDGNTEVDLCFKLALQEHDPNGWTGEYRSIIGNDERQFNGPGVRIPMLSLSRVLPPSAPEWPYREYHSSADTPELVPSGSLDESARLVLRMIEYIEENVVPVNEFKGEPFCSRYGLHIDAYSNPEGNRELFRILDLIDGSLSVAEIARRTSVPFDAVRDVVKKLGQVGLVSIRES